MKRTNAAVPLEDVADRIHTAAVKLNRRGRRVDSASMGFSGARVSALSILVYGGPRTIGALAASDGVRPPTMTGIVRRLEEAGFVERRPDPNDARATVVRVTRKGRDLIERGRRARIGAIVAMLEHLGDEDVATIARAADLLDRAMRDGTAAPIGAARPRTARRREGVEPT